MPLMFVNHTRSHIRVCCLRRIKSRISQSDCFVFRCEIVGGSAEDSCVCYRGSSLSSTVFDAVFTENTREEGEMKKKVFNTPTDNLSASRYVPVVR